MRLKTIFKNTLHFATGAQLLKRQFRYTRNDLATLAADANKVRERIKADKKPIDEWDKFVLSKGVKADALILQYRNRRLFAFLLLGALFYSAYFFIFGQNEVPGLVGSLISAVYYFKNTFRLYQIRYCELCSVKAYLKAIKKTFKEGLPLSLPKNWHLMPVKARGKQHDV